MLFDRNKSTYCNKKGKILCLDAKINFDDNALFRRPEILKLRDLMKRNQQKLKQVNLICHI